MKKFGFLFSMVFGLLLSFSVAMAGEVTTTLGWDANTEANLSYSMVKNRSTFSPS